MIRRFSSALQHEKAKAPGMRFAFPMFFGGLRKGRDARRALRLRRSHRTKSGEAAEGGLPCGRILDLAGVGAERGSIHDMMDLFEIAAAQRRHIPEDLFRVPVPPLQRQQVFDQFRVEPGADHAAGVYRALRRSSTAIFSICSVWGNISTG